MVELGPARLALVLDLISVEDGILVARHLFAFERLEALDEAQAGRVRGVIGLIGSCGHRSLLPCGDPDRHLPSVSGTLSRCRSDERPRDDARRCLRPVGPRDVLDMADACA